MEAGSAIPFPGGVGRIVSSAALQESAAWREAFARKAKDHRFYEIVEETLESGFEHHYLVLEDDTGVIRGIQPLFFVQQNIVEGVPAIRAAVDLIRRRFPRFLTMRVLMAGYAAGEGHLGASRVEDETWMATALQATLNTYARAAQSLARRLQGFLCDLSRRYEESSRERLRARPEHADDQLHCASRISKNISTA